MDRRKVLNPAVIGILLILLLQVGCGSDIEPRPKAGDMYYGVIEKKVAERIIGVSEVSVEKRNISDSTGTWELREDESSAIRVRVDVIRASGLSESELRSESDEANNVAIAQGSKEIESPELRSLGYGHLRTNANGTAYAADVASQGLRISVTLTPVSERRNSAQGDVVELLESAVKGVPAVMPSPTAASMDPRAKESDTDVVASPSFLASRLG